MTQKLTFIIVLASLVAVPAQASITGKLKLPMKAVACPAVIDIGLKKAKKIDTKIKGSVCKVLPVAKQLGKKSKKNQPSAE